MTLNIYEDGHIVRDFVYIDDVVRALILTAETNGDVLNPINIGSGIPLTILDAARTLLNLLGGGDYRISGQYRVGDVRFAVADITRAGNVLGWKPKVSVQNGLHALAMWACEALSAHNSGIKPL